MPLICKVQYKKDRMIVVFWFDGYREKAINSIASGNLFRWPHLVLKLQLTTHQFMFCDDLSNLANMIRGWYIEIHKLWFNQLALKAQGMFCKEQDNPTKRETTCVYVSKCFSYHHNRSKKL